MNVRFLTLHHNLTCSMVQPTHTTSTMNLSLVIGTSNNLYKAMHEDDENPQSIINSIIIEMWLEKIDFLLEKIVPLENQISGLIIKNNNEPMYFRVEYIDSNIVGLHLSDLFERLDTVLVTLAQLGKKSIDSSKYDKFLLYFGDKLSEIMHFPYQQSPELHQRILRAQV